MPNRILKESVCYSEQINSLTYFEEVLFYRILVNCDDFGRLDARPEFLRSRCFAVRQRVSRAALEAGIEKLEEIGLIYRYWVEKAVFLQVTGWAKHQIVKVQKQRFPAPSDGQFFGQSDGILNTIQSESKSESESESQSQYKEAPVCLSDPDFDAFWNAYPIKIRKDRAREAYAREVDVPVETLLRAISEQKRSVQWKAEQGKYIPYPTSWLKNHGWEDKLTPTIPKGASGELGEAELEAIMRVVKEKQNGKKQLL